MVSTMTLRFPRSQRGFTAVELIITVVIMAILGALALPSFQRLIQTQKSRTLAYDLFADLTFARSEAIARGHNVRISNVGGSWVNGWQITDITAAPAVQLRTNGECAGPTPPVPCAPIVSGATVVSPQDSYTFDRSGRTTANATFNIAPTDPGASDEQKRCLTLDTSGRAKSAKGVC